MSPRRAHAVLAGAFLVAGILWGAALGWMQVAGTASILDRLEGPFADMRFALAGPRTPPANVAIVAIDDRTVTAVGRYPLPRDRLATLVDRLREAGVAAVALDILFLDPGPPGADTRLVVALHKVPSVIAAAAMFDADAAATLESGIPVATRVMWPLRTFEQAAGVGLTNIVTDQGGTPRHIPLLTIVDGARQPSFPLKIAMIASGGRAILGRDAIALGAATTPLDLGAHLALRFYGPRGTIPTFSAAEFLGTGQPPLSLKGRIAIIGATATGAGDLFGTPFDAVLPGVEVQATALSNLETGGALARTTFVRKADAVAAILLPVALVVVLGAVRIGPGLALAAALLAAWMLATVIAFANGVWLSIAVPLAATLPVVLGYGASRLWLDHRIAQQARKGEAVLRGFQAPAIADRLKTSPDFLARPVTQQAAVVFVDLNGFTGLSEHVGPERTRVLLAQMHGLVDACVARHGGIVMSYMGDGAMAVFGVPDPHPNDAVRAVRTAQSLALEIVDWIASLEDGQRNALGVKVGAHAGTVVVSRLGGATHQHVTVTGDCVNVASRLMAVAAKGDALLACSEDVLTAAGFSPVQENFAPADAVSIRGRTGQVAVCLWRGPLRAAVLPKPSGQGDR